MGRHAGHIALNTGIATGAVQIITEEIPTPIDDVVENIKKIRESGKDHFIVIVSEGYGNPVEIATQIQEKTGIDSRATILGHVQRGGNPTLKDRVNATRMGYYAVKLLEEGKTNRVVALQQGNLVDYDIQEALRMKKPLDMDDFKEQVEANRIRMASVDSLAEKMKLLPGTVSPFGLLNNEDKDIRVYFDKDIVSEEIMTFHPNTNEKTIFIKTQDLFRFLESISFNYEILTLP